ncbi:tyrosine-type recombinase/integrase [Modestobacter caceresii]|uniref:tyrosine-type recombinase/integrase n=1 Tax=Modestobacter caceresii TaxID=1522368 RepID=UPI0012E043A9|nr:site-specific integrase [Modestobacter caceresii]
MAIRRRKSTDGKRTTYTVTWREGGARDGQQRGVTVSRLDEAKRIEAAIVAAGGHLPEEHRHLLRGARRVDTSESVNVPAEVEQSVPAALEAPTFADYAEQHVANLTGVEEGYRAQYRRDVARHMTPVFGDLPLTAVNRSLVRGWLRGLEAGTHPWLVGRPPLAYRTRKRLATEAGAVMRAALADELIVRDPFVGVRVGKPEHTASRQETIRALTHDEWRRLEAELPAGVYRDLATVAVGTGLRWSELTALECRHVVLDDGRPRVEVRQAWKDTRAGKADRYEIGRPKSDRSVREVTVGAGVAQVLARLVADRPEDAYVFTTPATSGTHAGRQGGAPIRSANYRHRVWAPAVARVFPHGRGVRFHDLRHTHASWLINAGRPLTEVQRRLGHESIQLTSDTYGWLLPSSTDAAVAAIEAAMAAEAEVA